MGKLFDELKRRNVIRVAVAYAVAAWVVLQIADLVLDNISAPDWVMQTFMLALGLGFPLVVLFSWAFELTPEGIKREKDVDRTQSVTHETAKKLDLLTIGMLVLVIGLVFYKSSFTPEQTGGAVLDDKSIAVLAFEDLSPEGDQVYFADGLSEELLNLLAKTPDLKVAGRTSSFAFKGKNQDLREIGEILQVAHILEGSVRKSGNTIRVTAQLINAADGFHVFSETYDDELSDIFEVQDAIARQITVALKAELLGEEALPEAAVTDVRAYELYLEARQKIHLRRGDEIREANALLDEALKIDPDYAPAIAQKAIAVGLLSNALGNYGDIPYETASEMAIELAEKALRIDPNLAEAHAALGNNLPRTSKAEQAEWHLKRALELNPNLDDASLWLSALLENLGREEEALALLEQVVARDPLFSPAFNNLVADYALAGDYDKATALIDRVERAAGVTEDVLLARANLAQIQGELAAAVRNYRRALELDSSSVLARLQYGLTLIRLGDYDELADMDIPGFPVYYHLVTGNTEQAMELTAQLQVSPNDDGLFSVQSLFYTLADRFEEVAETVENLYGGIDKLLAINNHLNSDGIGYMDDVALAYSRLGRQEEFEKVMSAMRAALDAQQARNTYSLDYWFSETSYAALTGDVDALLLAAQRYADAGEVTIEPFEATQFDPYRSNETFQAIEKIIEDRANAERAKLGLPPYRAPMQ